MTHDDLRRALDADPGRAVLLSPDAIRCLLDEYGQRCTDPLEARIARAREALRQQASNR